MVISPKMAWADNRTHPPFQTLPFMNRFPFPFPNEEQSNSRPAHLNSLGRGRRDVGSGALWLLDFWSHYTRCPKINGTRCKQKIRLVPPVAWIFALENQANFFVLSYTVYFGLPCKCDSWNWYFSSFTENSAISWFFKLKI
jgi:hypothetical protein